MTVFNNLIIYTNNIVQLSGKRVAVICVIGVVTGIGLGASEILFGLGLEKFLSSYDLLKRNEEYSELLPVTVNPLIYILAVAVILAFLRFFSFYFPNYARQLFMMRMRQLVNDETLREEGDVSEISVANVSHIMTNLVSSVGSHINAISTFLIATVRLFVLLAGLFSLSTELSLIAISAIIAFGFPTIIFRKHYVRLSKTAFNETASYTQNLIRNIRNVLLLKLSGKITDEKNILNQNNAQIHKFLMKFHNIYFVNMVWPNLLAIFVVVLMVVVNSEEKIVSPPTLVPFIFLLSRIASSISDITGSYGKYQISKPAFLDLVAYNKIMLRDRKVIDSGKNINISEPMSFSAENLSVGREKEILKNINIKLNQGDMLLISGESGAGKTTFIYTIIGLLRPIKGKVLWNEIKIEDVDQKSFRPYISYSGSDPFLFDATIEENIRLGQSKANRKNGDVEKVLELASCDFIHSLSGDLSYTLKEGGEGISAGQKQRISLARALLRKPKILLLDEATSNIDTDTEKKIFNNIRRTYPDMIIILVSHRDTAREFATKILNV